MLSPMAGPPYINWQGWQGAGVGIIDPCVVPDHVPPYTAQRGSRRCAHTSETPIGWKHRPGHTPLVDDPPHAGARPADVRRVYK